MHDALQLQVAKVVSMIQAHAGEPLTFTVQRNVSGRVPGKGPNCSRQSRFLYYSTVQ
jgi:hypothetical protein